MKKRLAIFHQNLIKKNYDWLTHITYVELERNKTLVT